MLARRPHPVRIPDAAAVAITAAKTSVAVPLVMTFLTPMLGRTSAAAALGPQSALATAFRALRTTPRSVSKVSRSAASSAGSHVTTSNTPSRSPVGPSASRIR